MARSIFIKRNGEFIFSIDADVFQLLFENTIVHRSKKYQDALIAESISFVDFIDLSRKGEVPYPLFFLEIQFVQKIVDDYYIVTDDNGLRIACSELNVKWLSVEDFSNV